ncbi:MULTISPECIES: hypothetical protein [Bacillus]|uniref:hypothetical protein n=1 Tax=Bacillus TaxID=1386 RepID=UPI0002F8EF40|nr:MULTISPECIES: hypothetical protein [Bacillus]
MSKILLLGEYSGVHQNLKEGLKELGHDVVVASDGDEQIRINSDIDLSLQSKYNITKLYELKKNYRILKAMILYNLLTRTSLINLACFSMIPFLKIIEKFIVCQLVTM